MGECSHGDCRTVLAAAAGVHMRAASHAVCCVAVLASCCVAAAADSRRFKPAPIYILDEVDAALDLNHTQNIGAMIKQHFPQVRVCV